MANIKFKFDRIKPVPVNQKSQLDRKRRTIILSSKYRECKQTIECLSKLVSMKMANFEYDLDITREALHAKIIYFTPDLLTKKNYISNKSMDVDGIPKVILDGIFNNFNKLDDKMICDFNVVKRMSPDDFHYVCVEIEKIPLEDLCSKSLSESLLREFES